MKGHPLHAATGVALAAICTAALPAFGMGEKPKCPQTVENILGPFYLPNAPERGNLIPERAAGEPLTVTGVVTDTDCKPAPGVTVDVWQADASGEYDMKGNRFRGKTKTDAEGRYRIETVLPGAYRLSVTRWRPAHIHFMVYGPGFKSLTTQLYFRGDRYLSGDPFKDDSLVVPLATTQSPDGTPRHTAEFSITLARTK